MDVAEASRRPECIAGVWVLRRLQEDRRNGWVPDFDQSLQSESSLDWPA